MDDTRCVEIVPISVGVGVGAGAAGAGAGAGAAAGAAGAAGAVRQRRHWRRDLAVLPAAVRSRATVASVATSSAHEQKQCGRSCLENFEVEPRSTWCQSRRREKTLEDCLHTTVHSYDRTTIVIQ